MKTIIAGGRAYKFSAADIAALDALRGEISEVVSGRAPGADRCGEEWAKSRGIPVQPFPAEWSDLSHPDVLIRRRPDGSEYDARAGFRRNQEMANYADACVLFPGRNGTADMARRAEEAGLRIIDLRHREMAHTYITPEAAENRLREGWLLQFCTSTRGPGWTWLRRHPGDSNPEYVRKNTASALRKRLGLEQTNDSKYSDFYYRLPKSPSGERTSQ